MSKHHPIRIIVAEDDADDRLLIRDAFAEGGCHCRLAFVHDGNELLAHLKGLAVSRDAVMPDLILLDLNMPGRDGRATLRALKADPATSHIPAIVLTTSHQREDVASCYALGASSYIVKPVTYSELVATARSLDHYWTHTSVLSGRPRDPSQ